MTLTAACAFSAASSTPPHSTGKERDAESGNDYFGARYYGSGMVRFMSSDWADKPEAVPYLQLDNPQSLNLYGYMNNNPLSKADPDGHCPWWLPALAGGGVLASSEEGAGVGAVFGGPVGAVVGGLIGLGVGAILVHEIDSHQGATPPSMPSPASTSQQGAADSKPVASFSPGVKAGADAAAGGKCEYCGTQTVPGQRSQAGVTPPGNERQTDHYIPSSKGGSDDAGNAANSCRTCNGAKSDTQPHGTKWELPRMQKPPNQ